MTVAKKATARKPAAPRKAVVKKVPVKKAATPAVPAVPEPPPKPKTNPIQYGDIAWYPSGFPLCCGAQIISGFRFSGPIRDFDAEISPACIKKWQRDLSAYPNTTAITNADRTGTGDNQRAAEAVLKAVGFVMVQRFMGIHNTWLHLWSYTRPSSLPREA